MHPTKLRRDALVRLSTSVRTPTFDPAALQTGLIHLGIGCFHRAHLARYTHDLLELENDARVWGIAGAGLRHSDRRLCEALNEQEGLYALVERSGEEEAVTIVGSLKGAIYAGDEAAALLDAIDAPGVRIVSLTVTENGYGLDPSTKTLNPQSEAIAGDLAAPSNPRSPIGVLAEAFRRRMIAGRPAFTAMSCDNIQKNGEVLRAAVLAFADRLDPRLACWIDTNGRFPSSMVDRITPLTAQEDVADLTARHGVADACPVFCETFRQWVVEDRFADGRPAWERVGVQVVADVAPYEIMKLRLLNASHLAIAALGRLAGRTYVHETMQDERFARFMRALMDRETGPTLRPVPGVDLEGYKAALVERFANPKIKDTVERVNTDAPINYLLDPLRDRLACDGGIDLLALALAGWIRRVRGLDETGAPIQVIHPLADALRLAALKGGPDPRPVLAIRPLFGDLAASEALVSATGRQLASLYEVGAVATLDRAAREHGF